MANFIVKLADDKYVQWSTNVDAPITSVMTKDEVLEFMKTDGRTSEDVSKRFDRLEAQGTTSMHAHSTDEMISCNRAGEGESKLTKEGIIELYTYSPDKVDKFPYFS